MKTKLLVMLAGGAMVLGGLAWMLAQRSAPTKEASPAGGKLFPEASGRLAETSRVVISKGTERVEVVRDAATNLWGLSASDGYPAVEENVRKLVRGVLEAEIVEKKTAVADLYDKIGVEEPTSEKAKGHLVSIYDAQGKSIAELIVGNRFDAANYDQDKAGTFVRPGGQAQSYLVKGTFNLASKPTDWLKRDVLALDASRFWKATVQQPAGADGTPGGAVHIERASRSEEKFSLAELPADRELFDPTVHQRLLQTLATWTLDDVRKASGVDMSGAVVGTFITFDGVVYTTACVKKDGKYWATVTVSYDPSAAAPRGAGDAPLAEDHDATVKKEVEAVNAKVAGWVFQIADNKGKELSATLESLLKPLAPDKGAPDVPAPSEPGGGVMIPPG